MRAALDIFNADRAEDIQQAHERLPELLKGVAKIFHDKPSSQTSPIVTTKDILNIDSSLLAPKVNELRAIKSPAEIAAMRHAGQVSGRAITDAMRQPWKTESDLAAFLNYSFTKDGLDGPAYVPVVSGGRRNLLIHYVLNNAALDPEDLVVVDAGGEYGTYITDITRVWPVNGKFSAAQRDLYEAVLTVQRQSVSLCRANADMSLDNIHEATRTGLQRELAKLGIPTEGHLIDVLFPHHVGHYVGLDVHDTPGYGRNIDLKEGHCVTIEPGVYIPDEERWPAHFRNMGIRIEDSIAVGAQDPYVLTTEAVKEVVDIEALRG